MSTHDLAAMAYLYKRLKEDTVIREAGHVVIDEAQDFGMMAYASLKYCLSKCTYTIMGDVAQEYFRPLRSQRLDGTAEIDAAWRV